MPDQYGGIEVDEPLVAAPARNIETDEWGGELVPSGPTMLPEVSQHPEEAGARVLGISEPLISIPRLEATDPRFQAFVSGLTGRPPSLKASESVAAAANVAKTLPEFATSPLGIATAPIGALGGLPAKLLGAGFAGQMATEVPEAAREAGRVSVEGTPQEQKEAILGLGSNIVLPGLLAAPALAEVGGAVRRGVSIPPRTAPLKPIVPELPPEQPMAEAPIPIAPEPPPAPPPTTAATVSPAPTGEGAPVPVPEVARMGPETAGGKDPIGNPLGTKYYATPEDWAKWRDLNDKLAAAKAARDPSAMAEIGPQVEAMKNKYGGQSPLLKPDALEPALLVNDKPITGGANHEAIFKKATAAAESPEAAADIFDAQADESKHVFVDKAGNVYTREQAATALGEKDPLQSSRLRELQAQVKPAAAPEAAAPGALKVTPESIRAELAKYEDSGEHATIGDLVDSLEAFVEEDPDADGSGLIQTAIDRFRREQEYDRELAGRGDMDKAEENFLRQTKKAADFAQKQADRKAPPAPTEIEGTPIAGKTLGEWEAVRTAADLPKGDKRAELAKWLAVPNQPSRILQALANKKRTREIHAPPASEVAPVAPVAPVAETPPPVSAPPPAAPPAESDFDRITREQEALEAKRAAAIGKGDVRDVLDEANLTKEQRAAIAQLSPIEFHEVIRLANEGNLNRSNFDAQLKEAKARAARSAKGAAIDIQAQVTPEPLALPAPEMKPAEPATPAPVAETAPAAASDIFAPARNWVKSQSDAVKGFLVARMDAYDRWKSAKGATNKRNAKAVLDAADRELAQAKAEHKKAVERAYGEGKTVPPDVLKDYPDLANLMPTKALAAPQAAAKAQAEVSKVAAVEGQRPAKEVKSELVSRLEEAADKAPSETDAWVNFAVKDERFRPAELVEAGTKGAKSLSDWIMANQGKYPDAVQRFKVKALESSKTPKVTIDIPGDGTFTVWNTKEALSELLDRAKKLSTASGAPTKVTRRTVTKEQAQEFMKEAEQPPPGPGKIGMGGALEGEIQATGPRGEPTHGIAARVLEQRRQQGVIAPVEPGEGITAEESVERGRALLAAGANPQAVLDAFNRTKAVSAEGMAVARAWGERLAKTAYAMADAHGIHSPEYEAAWEADSAWAKAVKPMQTEWHKIGKAQQGETEIDTGTFHGLRHAFFDATGKDFTPKQAAEAEKIAKGVKEAGEAADKAKADVFAEVGKQAKATPEKKPAAPKPGEVASPDATTLWKRAKAMIDAGESDFDSIRHKLAQEFGIPVEDVTRKLAEPKSARTITDDMYRKMAEQRRLVNQAKSWLKNEATPGWLQFARKVPRVFFTAKILGHGTVGMITHAGLNIFNPIAWRTYWPNFFRQYKLIASGAYHERMMQDLLRDPLFTKARRAGLANDPFRYQDDYQTPTLVKWLDRIGLTGNRGFDALKLFRQARFNQIWNALPDTLQTPEYAKLVADSVNHATGAVRRPFREWANWTFFAPKLEASRWAWMVKDPWDAAKTFVDWNKATPEEKAFAMSQLKEKAAIAGTYYSLLMINQGLLQASGSEQRINFVNPRRGDFLAFKAAGHNIGIVGPMLGMVRLFANLYHAAAGKRGKVESLTPRGQEFGELGFQYARGKLSPFAGFGVDVVSQADFQGRPMPYSTDAVPKYLRQQGLDRYTYGEYAAQQFTPIPLSEAVREVWRDQGMGEDQIDAYLKALMVGVVAGSTGARVSAESPPSRTQ